MSIQVGNMIRHLQDEMGTIQEQMLAVMERISEINARIESIVVQKDSEEPVQQRPALNKGVHRGNVQQ